MSATRDKKQNKQTVGFTLDPSVVLWLKGEAEKAERSMSFIVNKILLKESGKDQRG